MINEDSIITKKNFSKTMTKFRHNQSFSLSKLTKKNLLIVPWNNTNNKSIFKLLSTSNSKLNTECSTQITNKNCNKIIKIKSIDLPQEEILSKLKPPIIKYSTLSSKISKIQKIINRKGQKNFNSYSLKNNNTENNCNAYYLEGGIPYNKQYLNDYDKTIKTESNKRINKLNSFKMSKTDTKIEKLVKKLKLKLNSDKIENETICSCGNMVATKNGFFNGMNLVLENQDFKSIENLKTENKHRKIHGKSIKNKWKKSKIYVNGYNYAQKKLPIFLRDKYNIKGTTVMSPFCINARDQFLYKKIFHDLENRKLIKRKYINNKLNLVYAENEEQYDFKIEKMNEKIKEEGKRVVHRIEPKEVDERLNNINKKVIFMKKIIDYAYPNMVLVRIRENNKIIDSAKKKKVKLLKNKQEIFLRENKNKELDNFVIKSNSIKKI